MTPRTEGLSWRINHKTTMPAAVSDGGFGNNNPDLSVRYASVQMGVTGVQPGVGDSFDRYHEWSSSNS